MSDKPSLPSILFPKPQGLLAQVSEAASRVIAPPPKPVSKPIDTPRLPDDLPRPVPTVRTGGPPPSTWKAPPPRPLPSQPSTKDDRLDLSGFRDWLIQKGISDNGAKTYLSLTRKILRNVKPLTHENVSTFCLQNQASERPLRAAWRHYVTFLDERHGKPPEAISVKGIDPGPMDWTCGIPVPVIAAAHDLMDRSLLNLKELPHCKWADVYVEDGQAWVINPFNPKERIPAPADALAKMHKWARPNGASMMTPLLPRRPGALSPMPLEKLIGIFRQYRNRHAIR